MVAAEIATGYSALKTAYEIAKGLKDIHDRVQLNDAIIDLQERILAAQEAAASARDRLRELQETVAAYENWATIEARYQLKDFGNHTFAYELKSIDDEPYHLVCPSCFQERRRQILQYVSQSNNQRHYRCGSCKQTFSLGEYRFKSPAVRRHRSDRV